LTAKDSRRTKTAAGARTAFGVGGTPTSVLRFAADGRIGHDRFFCGGRWDAGLLAEMAAANDAG
jgi:hypothetical protein